MWNHVGSPSMFEGKTFLPLHGMPIACRARSKTRLADWLPDPLTVPTRIARSFTPAGAVDDADASPPGMGIGSTAEADNGMVRLGAERGHRGHSQDASGALVVIDSYGQSKITPRRPCMP